MPTVAIYYDFFNKTARKTEGAVHRLKVYLPDILAETLSTKPENVIILPPQEMDRRSGPKIFIDILVKRRPHRARNLKERHKETCRRIIEVLSHQGDWLNFESIALRIAIVPLEYSTLAEAVSS